MALWVLKELRKKGKSEKAKSKSIMQKAKGIMPKTKGSKKKAWFSALSRVYIKHLFLSKQISGIPRLQ
jgi:hypothetical protein